MSYSLLLTTVVIILILLYILFKLYEINKSITNTNKSSLVSIKTSTIEYEEQHIPKIIIQTWKTNTIPQRYMQLIESIKQYNPDYQYIFFTDDDIEDFLKTNYPEYYRTYLNLPITIQRIDFFRYIAVYHFGGFYMDLDMLCLKSFDSLLKHKCVFPVDEFITENLCHYRRYRGFCQKENYFLLGQYAFAAAPRHPFIKRLIDYIHKNINYYIKYVNYDSEDYVYKTTGPDFVTNLYIDDDDKDNIIILNNGKRQFFGDYAKHNYFGTWK